MTFQDMFNSDYKINKPKYNPFQERILKILSLAQRRLTTRQVAFYSGISYNTVKKNLEKLEKSNLVKNKILANRIYWSM
jgi:DNA-binding transcriptional regulator YhcF (GntR family)